MRIQLPSTIAGAERDRVHRRLLLAVGSHSQGIRVITVHHRAVSKGHRIRIGWRPIGGSPISVECWHPDLAIAVARATSRVRPSIERQNRLALTTPVAIR